MTEYEEYKQTNMLGSYQPERALLRKTDDGVQPVFRDAAYYYDEDAVVVERDMMVGKHLLPRQQRNGKGGERKRPAAAAVYSSALKVRTAIISFACSRSRMSWSTPK